MNLIRLLIERAALAIIAAAAYRPSPKVIARCGDDVGLDGRPYGIFSADPTIRSR